MTQRLAVVTGAARGFGAALVDAFTDAGWAVVAAGRVPPSPPRPGVAEAVWDVTDDDTTAIVEAVAGRPVDVLVNNAGCGVPGTPLPDVRVADLLAVVDVTVGGVIRACQALLPHLGAADDPIVVNVSSRLASLNDQAAGTYTHLRTSHAYRVAKSAQNAATIALAHELRGRIRVVALHPGELATAMGQADATTDPRSAADDLVRLLEAGDLRSPSFVRPDGSEIAW